MTERLESQLTLGVAALGAAFAQALCRADPSLHGRLKEAATAQFDALKKNGDVTAAGIPAAFLRALNDPFVLKPDLGFLQD